MFSKESGIVAVAAVILYDQLFARDLPWNRRIPGWIAAVAPAVFFLIVRARVLAHLPIGPFPFTDNPIVGGGFLEGRMTGFKVIVRYLGLLVWPAKLSADYSSMRSRCASMPWAWPGWSCVLPPLRSPSGPGGSARL